MNTKNMIQRLCFLLLVLALSTQAQAAATFTICSGTLNGQRITQNNSNAASVTVSGFQFRFSTTGSILISTDANGEGFIQAEGGTLTVSITVPSDVSMSRVSLTYTSGLGDTWNLSTSANSWTGSANQFKLHAIQVEYTGGGETGGGTGGETSGSDLRFNSSSVAVTKLTPFKNSLLGIPDDYFSSTMQVTTATGSTAIATDPEFFLRTLTYTSSDKSIATVSNDGTVTPTGKKGTTTITAHLVSTNRIPLSVTEVSYLVNVPLTIDADKGCLLADAADWKAFADLDATLVADIDLGTEIIMVGTPSNPYSGIFDGAVQ